MYAKNHFLHNDPFLVWTEMKETPNYKKTKTKTFPYLMEDHQLVNDRKQELSCIVLKCKSTHYYTYIYHTFTPVI